MCNKWIVYCACCNDFIYLLTFKNCGIEECTIVDNTILLQSYCDLCILNGCRNVKQKCVEKELNLKFTTMKTAAEMNYNRGTNIKHRKC